MQHHLAACTGVERLLELVGNVGEDFEELCVGEYDLALALCHGE